MSLNAMLILRVHTQPLHRNPDHPRAAIAMELVTQASLLAVQTDRLAAPGTAADRARLRFPAGPVARSPSIGRRAGAPERRSFPVDQIDVRPRTDNRPEQAVAAVKSAGPGAGRQAEAQEGSERTESASQQLQEGESAGIGRRESPLSRAPARLLPPGSRLNISV